MPKAVIIEEKRDIVHYCIAQWLLYKGIEVEILESPSEKLHEIIEEYQVIVSDRELSIEKTKSEEKIIVLTSSERKRDDVPVTVSGNMLVLHSESGLYMLFRMLEHLMSNKGLLDTTPRNIDFSTVEKP